MYLLSNDPVLVSDDHLDARLDPGVIGRRHAARALQRQHLVADLDGLDGLRRAVRHLDQGALGTAVLIREVLIDVVVVRAMTELHAIPRAERACLLLLVIGKARVHCLVGAARPADGLHEHGQLSPQVKRPPRGRPPWLVVRVVRVRAPLVLCKDLRVGLVNEHLGLTGSGRTCPERLAHGQRVELCSPLRRHVDGRAGHQEFVLE